MIEEEKVYRNAAAPQSEIRSDNSKSRSPTPSRLQSIISDKASFQRRYHRLRTIKNRFNGACQALQHPK